MSVENGTTILFGLPGVAVDRVEVDDEGGRMVHLRTDEASATACPACGVFSTSVRQRRTTRPKDLPYGEAPLVVRWHKRQFTCRERSCPRTAFTESIAELPPYARITGRTRRAAGASISTGRSVRAVCAELPMSWPTAHAAFVDHAERLLTEPAAPQVLGIDETRRGRPRWSKDEDGSTAPGNHAGQPVPRRPFPLNFEEPSSSPVTGRARTVFQSTEQRFAVRVLSMVGFRSRHELTSACVPRP